MVFGLQLSIARLGSTVNFIVMEPMYKYISHIYHGPVAIGVVLLLASITCFMSFFCALILGWMDRRAQRILRRNDNPSGETVRLSDIFTFKVTFWMVSIICVAYYVAIFPFIALGKVFFESKFGFNPEQANAVNSIVYVISAVASPLFGFIVDRTGRNVFWVWLATCSTLGAHATLAFTYLNPYIGMVLMGLSYSMLASSLWPLVALIIPEYQLGTAYGICQSVQNLGLAVISIISGLILDKSNGNYLWLQLFFMGWLSVALIATLIIWLYDRTTDGNLNLTPKQRQQRMDIITATAAKRLAGSGSVEDLGPEDIQSSEQISQNSAIRNRNLKRNSLGEYSDQEPLLN